MSKITVTTIAGQTSGGDANTVKIESGDTLAVQTNATVGGTLGVTGNTTMGGTAAITGNTTVGGTLVNTGKITASAGVAIGGTGDANTLDDYEEGTWTAGISAGSGSIALQSSFQTGLYTKIGDMVYVNLHMRVGALSGNSGTLNITGLPFASPNDNKYRFSGVCAAHFGLQNLGAGDRLMPYVSSNSTNMTISNANGNSISSNSNSYMVANQSEMYLTLCYKTS